MTNLSNSALAFVWDLEMSGRDLCALRRLSARRQSVAQPGERSPRSRIIPGFNVVIPSTPEDAAGLLWTAMHCEDPTFVPDPETSALGGTRIDRAGPRGAVRSGAQTSARAPT